MNLFSISDKSPKSPFLDFDLCLLSESFLYGAGEPTPDYIPLYGSNIVTFFLSRVDVLGVLTSSLTFDDLVFLLLFFFFSPFSSVVTRVRFSRGEEAG